MGNGGTAAVLEPTFSGYVASTHDALILFEACLTGVLHHVPRRPHDRERAQLVRSGSVFIYEENASGIKRWTDGVTWSPSRILGNFLVYRELDKPFPPGEKKRAVKKGSRRPTHPTRPGEPYPRPQEPNGGAYSPNTPTPSAASYGGSVSNGSVGGDRTSQSELERALVGSLVDSYGFKDSGLVKKTMSVTVTGVTHHLVSYYSVDDVIRGALTPPSMVDHLRGIKPRPELITKQSFRAPIEDPDQPGMDEAADASQALYGYRSAMVNGYGMPPQAPAYYQMPPAGYPVHPHHPQTALSGYPVQPAANPYLNPAAASSDIPPKTEDYSSFRTPAGYSAFEPLNPPMSQQHLPHSMNRQPPQPAHPNHTQPQLYRTPSIPGRPGEVPTSVDPNVTSPHAYARSSFSMPENSQQQQQQPQPQPQPQPPQQLDQRTMAQPTYNGNGRRESNPVPSYYNGDASQQPVQPPQPPHQQQQQQQPSHQRRPSVQTPQPQQPYYGGPPPPPGPYNGGQGWNAVGPTATNGQPI